MKNLLKFILVYIIIIASMISSYMRIIQEKQNDLSFTQNEINGVTYLKSIYHLGISTILYHGNFIFEDDKEIIAKSKKSIKNNIATVLNLQEKFPEFKNDGFNKKMNKILFFSSNDNNKFHDFFDDINHENYRIGDTSQLLFEVDRKSYFLGSLLTHYMPEYLLSTLISHNIIKELTRKSFIDDEKQAIFIEQNKLIFLSAEEISGILNLIKKYKDTKVLSSLIEKIQNKLNKLPSNLTDLRSNRKLAQKYIDITHEILDLSYQLNDANIKILKDTLVERKNELIKTIWLYKFISVFLLLIISLIMYLFYKSFNTNINNLKNIKKEKDKTQEALNFKSLFLSNMSHEIRTPLNSIISLNNLTLKTKLDEKQSYMLQRANAASNILLGVINDILDISKIESGKMHIETEPLDIKKCITDVYDMLLIKAQENGISLEIKMDNLFNIYRLGDSLRIAQVLTNLLSNAIKFTEHGNVCIEIKELDDNRFRFLVKDTGIGLTQKQMDTLFEEFTQADMSTSRKYGGTGLGLSISKKLVKLMGGKIWVDSTYGEGSTFGFIIPLLPDLTSRDETQNQADDTSKIIEKINNLLDINILVAEDNKMNQMVLTMLLEEAQIKLDFADDGQIAVEKFDAGIYQLILMDIQMPNLNGYEATQIIKTKNKDIPIIGLSANAMQEDIQKAFDSGMDDYLTKPIDLDKLYLTLNKYLG